MNAEDRRYPILPVRSEKEQESALNIRIEVFVREQDIPEEMEFEDEDADALHVLAYDGNRPIGTGRLLLSDRGGEIGRIAVLPDYRRHGIGAAIVRRLEEEGRSRGAERFELTPHRHLEDFYARLGYESVGDAGDVAGHPLIRMVKGPR